MSGNGQVTRRRVAILGSTGSIGVQALDLIERLPERFEVVALAAGSNVELLAEQIRLHRPRLAALADTTRAAGLSDAARAARCEVAEGEAGLLAVAGHPAADVVLAGIVGAAGLGPTWQALKQGKRVALANKESLVMAGPLMRGAMATSGASLVPVDSEHVAVHQCLRGERIEEVRRLILTASGGPFRTTPLDRLAGVTPAEAVRHPVWEMGRKISVDSATLMNKGLEVIEAHWLFGLPGDRIDVVLHPQSSVHSMVEMTDGSVMAQVGVADMRAPIQYALAYPERFPGPVQAFDFGAARTLDFEPVDRLRYPSLDLAYAALATGGTAPAALNAANEVAVQAFLDGRLPFPGIARLVDQVLQRHTVAPLGSLQDVVHADAAARRRAEEILAMKGWS
ncbi:MAG TPA: 1-deoxy-D-xylulose-5-phosphate reductoisomerase [Candidatus Polarisedimenticolia bacterium]|nr:1-deoxy-D-xylulose-5-phosphate reductoisomerase [Candidatus Polarisedimenticolia bacterium]